MAFTGYFCWIFKFINCIITENTLVIMADFAYLGFVFVPVRIVFTKRTAWLFKWYALTRFLYVAVGTETPL